MEVKGRQARGVAKKKNTVKKGAVKKKVAKGERNSKGIVACVGGLAFGIYTKNTAKIPKQPPRKNNKTTLVCHA